MGVRAYHAAWRQQNRERVLAIAKRSRERRKETIWATHVIRKAAAKGKRAATPKQIAALRGSTDGYCVYCGRRNGRIEIDHVQPIATGGKSYIDNLIPSCKFCNISKNARPVEDWLLDRHGVNGLVRALTFLEQGKMPTFLLYD